MASHGEWIRLRFKITDHEAKGGRPVLDDVADLSTVWLEYNSQPGGAGTKSEGS